MNPIQGIHHITAIASDPQKNVDFYHEALGQRLVKVTVNYDDPGTYHLYYGDKIGSPGTIMTYFPWIGMRRGYPGNGETGAVAYAIRPESLDYWRQRLQDYSIPIREETRFGDPILTFHDPDGLRLELVTTRDPATFQHWSAGPVPQEHALRGFHGVTLRVAKAQDSARVLVESMGYQQTEEEDNRIRFKAASNATGLYIDLLVHPNEGRGIMGAGTVHHVAFRAASDEEQLAYRQKILRAGLSVTDVRDRQYFRSIYFREPGGVLFEIATDAPGFSYDEPVEELGAHLKLPEWLEPQREQIERALPKFNIPQWQKEAGDD